MGASSWRYYTPHRPDPEQALQELRQDVFARRDYSMGMGGFARPGGGGFPGNPLELLTSGAFAANPVIGRLLQAVQTGDLTGLSPEERFAVEQLRAFSALSEQARQAAGGGGEDDDEEGSAPGAEPETIDELLEMVAEDGTHSILDIAHVGPDLDFGVAAPLPPSRVVGVFGSAQPTHEQVEANWDEIAEGLERWQAYYLTVYRDGQPAEYVFIGCSGD
jgi:hypothetical protein